MSTDIDFSLVKRYFHISLEGMEHPLVEVEGTDLLDGGKLLPVLESGGRLVRATGLELPVSFAGMTLCNLCAVSLIFIVQYNRMPDLSLSNLTFQLESHGDHAHLGFQIKEARYKDVPDKPGPEREAFIMREWEPFIRESVAPAIETIAGCAGLKPELVWGQFGAHMLRVKGMIAEMEKGEEALARLEHDYRVLTETVPADWFNLRRNPFPHRPRFVESPYRPGEQWMIRSACCMYYCREGGEKCFNCPRLTPDEREAMRESIMAKSV